jgi:hypothetical protein
VRLIALAAIVVAIVEGCSTAPSRPTASFRCPVTPGLPAPEADQSFTKVQGTAFGNGPVFAVVYDATNDRIPFPTPWPNGVYIQKVPWMSRASYSGDVSVSGRRLDAAGEALFGWGVPPDMGSLHWSVPGINGNFQPASAGVRSAGCYEWDVVGRGFREKIVFNASLG